MLVKRQTDRTQYCVRNTGVFLHKGERDSSQMGSGAHGVKRNKPDTERQTSPISSCYVETKENRTNNTTLDLEAEDYQWGDYQGVRRRPGEKGEGEGGHNQSTYGDAMKKPYVCTNDIVIMMKT